MTSSIFKMAAVVAQFYFRVVFCDVTFSSGQHTKYRQDNSIIGWDINISVLKNKRPPYWNSSSGFDFNHITVIRTIPVFCIKLPNFIYIGPPNTEIWRLIDFLLVPVFYVRKLKVYKQTICCDHISTCGWDITTSVSEKQTGYRISSKSKHPLRKYDVISIFQDGGHNR